jgi:decaprenylphospho-beta-D-ribofuranose 2-oxidase
MKELVSFDGGIRLQCIVARPERYRSLTSRDGGPRISRGAGLSYSAASFGGGAVSLDHQRFNRVLAFDASSGVVTVEPGISLGALFDFLAPRGFFLAIQPGHPAISVGGCVAADVHGKNQFRDGNFSSQVEGLRLFHPLHGVLELSRDSAPGLFALTCGGCGLTGTILSVTLRAGRIPGAQIDLVTTPLQGLQGLSGVLEDAAGGSDCVFSWHDLSLSARPFGRGLLMHGAFIKGKDTPARHRAPRPLTAAARGRWYPPLLNSATAAAANALLFRSLKARTSRCITLHEALFPLARRGSRYFDLYGRRGFHEYQVLVPSPHFDGFAAELERRVRRHRIPVTLASAKFFGGKQEFLRFDGPGVCFAINLPRTAASARFLSLLDELSTGFRGIPNIIKDSRLPRAVAERAFPQFERFRRELLDFDPQRLYRSELSERLGL